MVHTIRPSFHGPSLLSLFSGCSTCAVFSRCGPCATCRFSCFEPRRRRSGVRQCRSGLRLRHAHLALPRSWLRHTPTAPARSLGSSAATHAHRARLLVVVLQIDATPASGSGPLLVTAITGSVRPPARHCHRRVSAASCSSLPPPVSAASLPTCGFGPRVLALRFFPTCGFGSRVLAFG